MCAWVTDIYTWPLSDSFIGSALTIIISGLTDPFAKLEQVFAGNITCLITSPTNTYKCFSKNLRRGRSNVRPLPKAILIVSNVQFDMTHHHDIINNMRCYTHIDLPHWFLQAHNSNYVKIFIIQHHTRRSSKTRHGHFLTLQSLAVQSFLASNYSFS